MAKRQGPNERGPAELDPSELEGGEAWEQQTMPPDRDLDAYTKDKEKEHDETEEAGAKLDWPSGPED